MLSNEPGTLVPVSEGVRILFFGMPCAFSLPPFRACLEAGVDIRALVLPAGTHEPASRPLAPITDLARRAAVPIVELTRSGAGDLATDEPDLIVVACWPWRLPAKTLALPRLGCLNVHPSLLPLGRGPEPVFWTLRRGERQTGTTIHLMGDGLDTGPILAQEAVTVPDGVRAPDLERTLAELGGRLLIESIAAVTRGTARPVPQDGRHATVAPSPGPADYLVPTNLPAGWAYNFVRGVAPLRVPPRLVVLATGEQYPLSDALAYAADDRLSAPVMRDGDELLVQFQPGTARLRLATSAPAHRTSNPAPPTGSS